MCVTLKKETFFVSNLVSNAVCFQKERRLTPIMQGLRPFLDFMLKYGRIGKYWICFSHSRWRRSLAEEKYLAELQIVTGS